MRRGRGRCRDLAVELGLRLPFLLFFQDKKYACICQLQSVDVIQGLAGDQLLFFVISASRSFVALLLLSNTMCFQFVISIEFIVERGCLSVVVSGCDFRIGRRSVVIFVISASTLLFCCSPTQCDFCLAFPQSLLLGVSIVASVEQLHLVMSLLCVMPCVVDCCDGVGFVLYVLAFQECQCRLSCECIF